MQCLQDQDLCKIKSSDVKQSSLDSHSFCNSLELGCSPVKVEILLKYLEFYTNRVDAEVLAEGFKYGFKIDYSGPRVAREHKNLKSAVEQETFLLEKIGKEIDLGRIAGPFSSSPIQDLIVSPIGLVPKSDGGWRMITHLSYPEGGSVNDGIDDSSCSVQYTSFDKVTNMIHSLGYAAQIAKRDLKSAYRILPIRVEDFQLLGIKVKDKYYIDKFLPMGLSQSARLFETFSTFLHWLVAQQSGLDTLDHMLDDFIFAGPKKTHNCQTLVDTFEIVCMELGVPIATEKSVEPTTVMVFLGFEINTNDMSVRIPCHKIVELSALLSEFLSRNKVTLKQLQSLVGKLNFFSRAIRSGRAFLRRFYDAMAPLKKQHHHLRLTFEMKQDILVWQNFLSNFNGVSYIPENVWFDNNSLQLFTDSAGAANLGAACFLNGEWCFFPWPEYWSATQILKDLTFLEMVPVILAMYLWGKKLANRKITLSIDNEALVSVLNRQTSKSKGVMQLVRPFVLMSMTFGITFKAVHISSKENAIADSISRKQWSRFKALAPEAKGEPLGVPREFQKLIYSLKLESFYQHQ